LNNTILSLLSFILGIALFEQNFYSINPSNSLIPILIVMTILTLLILLKIFKILPLLKLLILLTLLASGYTLAQHKQHTSSPNTIDSYASEEGNYITLQGRISEEPDIRRDKVNYTIEVISKKNTQSKKEDSENSKIPKIENWVPLSGRILIQVGKYPSYSYNDRIEISGNLQTPTSFEGFDYAGYLSRYGIYSVMYRPRVNLLENNKTQYRNAKQDPSSNIQLPQVSSLKPLASSFQPSTTDHRLQTTDPKPSALDPRQYWPFFYKYLLKIKLSFETQMNKTFSTEPSSSFMAGLLLGSRKGIPEKLSEAFRITGLTHIIAISGYNITLIASLLMAFFRPFGKRKSIILAGSGIIIFTLFAGASAAVVRACIMGLISLFALHSERKADITITLLLSAVIMVGYNPKILFHDVGFQLSFLATMGLIYVSPLIEPYFKWLPNKLAIRESILLTLSAQIMALPIILFNFQALSVVSPLSNLLIAGPILPLAMLFGFLGVITSYLSLALAKLVAYPAYLLLQYVTNITTLTAKIPYASVKVTWFQKPLFISYFIALSLWLLWTWKKKEQQILHIQQLKLIFHQRLHFSIRQHFLNKNSLGKDLIPHNVVHKVSDC
jgi:ComEC/Rec2-related protein